MTTITLVTESKLYLKDNTALYTYFDDYSKLFNFLVRRCVHHLKNKLNGEKESQYRTNLMFDFGITNRMAKAVMKTAKNQLKLLTESARYQYKIQSYLPAYLGTAIIWFMALSITLTDIHHSTLTKAYQELKEKNQL